MADFINKIRTSSGDKQINYDALANLPAKNLAPGTNIDNVMEPGIYAGAYTANYNDHPYTMPFMLLVSTHNTLDSLDNSTTCQIRVYCDPMSEQPSDIIQRRISKDGKWDNWVSIGDEIINISPSGGVVDLEYDPESPNAQSGIAVAQAIEGIGGSGGALELLGTVTLEEETTTIQITTDLQGNPFELKELYAHFKIPKTTNGMQPYVYMTNLNKGRVMSKQTAVINGIVRWKKDELFAELNEYQYETPNIKTAQIISISDEEIVNQFKIVTFGDAFPVGTELTLKGKKV